MQHLADEDDSDEDEDCSTSGWCAGATLPRLPTLIQSKLALPRPPTATDALSVSTATALLLPMAVAAAAAASVTAVTVTSATASSFCCCHFCIEHHCYCTLTTILKTVRVLDNWYSDTTLLWRDSAVALLQGSSFRTDVLKMLLLFLIYVYVHH